MKIADDELKEMHRRMAQHYGSPVLPLKEVCAAFETWVAQLIIKYRDPHADARPSAPDGESPPEWLRQLAMIRLSIRKSNLLYRLLYFREPLRTEKCPIHKGVWSGIGVCEHGCQETGWLPNKAL